MSIRVVNLRDKDCPEGVYVGRPSVLGNPFKSGRDGTRAEAVQKYREHLAREILTDQIIGNAILDLFEKWQDEGELVLQCYCAPKACHADVIKELLEYMATKE